MESMAEYCWKKLACKRSQVNLDKLLVCGQSFRWKKNGLGEWLGVMANLVWRFRQAEDCIEFKVYGREEKPKLSVDSDTVRCNSKLTSKPMLHISRPDFVSNPDLRTRNRKRMVKSTPQQDDLAVKSECRGCVKRRKAEPPRPKALPTKSTKNLEDIVEATASADSSELLNGESNFDGDDSRHTMLLRDYFQLDIDLVNLYSYWSSKDPHFSEVAGSLEGIRILRQDPTENLLSFVCSSNNNISRISGMVDNLCRHYGDFITVVDGEEYFSVPSFRSLSGERVEAHLRQLGFGYRAKFIASIARHLVEHKADGWLDSLRCQSYEEAKRELLTLMGVGPKVADCVCLMSLDKPGAVPVDTHVWQITLKHYMAQLNTAKSLTDKIYNEIGDFYRQLWGPYAGWAHSVLFTADLKQNKPKKDSQPATRRKTSKAGTQEAAGS